MSQVKRCGFRISSRTSVRYRTEVRPFAEPELGTKGGRVVCGNGLVAFAEALADLEVKPGSRRTMALTAILMARLDEARAAMRNAVVAAVALIRAAAPCSALAGDDADPAPCRAKRMFYGHWRRITASEGPRLLPSEVLRCFLHRGAVGGVFTESTGDGGDFCERWRVERQRVRIWDDYGNVERCLYRRSEDRQTLILTTVAAVALCVP